MRHGKSIGRVVVIVGIALAVTLVGTAPAGARTKTLYSQRGKLTKDKLGINSQDYETANDNDDNQAADDFVVPQTKTWKVTQVDFDGGYGKGTINLAKSFTVYFYKDDGGLPGQSVTTEKNLKYSAAELKNSIKLRDPVHLSGGHYWVSIQARQDLADGTFYWGLRTTKTAHSPAAWQNPSGAANPDCTTWAPAGPCVNTHYKELSFDLKGKAKAHHAAVASSSGGSG